MFYRSTIGAALAAVTLCLPAAIGLAAPGNGGWLTDFESVKAAAAQSGRPILVNFTNAELPPCKAQQQEVFDTPAFKKWAGENVTLLLIEYVRPNDKRQSKEQKQHNEAFKTAYHLDTFPTVLVLRADGSEVQRWKSYKAGTGAEEWIKRTQGAVDKAK